MSVLFCSINVRTAIGQEKDKIQQGVVRISGF